MDEKTNRNELRSEFAPDCPIRNILSRICDKWSMLVLYTLQQKPVMRFNELRKSIPDISQKVLTTTLRTLEEDGKRIWRRSSRNGGEGDNQHTRKRK